MSQERYGPRAGASLRRCVLSVLTLTVGSLTAWTVLTDRGPLPPLAESGSPSVAAAGEAASYLALGEPRKLDVAFARWRSAHEQSGGDRRVTLSVRWAKGLSARQSRAQGVGSLNLVDGNVTFAFTGLDDIGPADLWLVHNTPGPGRSVRPEAGDEFLYAGTAVPDGRGEARLAQSLGRSLTAFEVDLVMVAPRGSPPAESGVLFGALPLFQRLYSRDRRAQAAQPAGRWPELLSSHVLAAGGVPSLDPLVARGAKLFFNETFNGNRRTCGSCHRAENNLTIDPQFIATLPRRDPLFVAEFDANLSKDFEKPLLMRKLGVILENVDGTDDLPNKFTMRGVPHTLAMTTSLSPAPDNADGSTVPPDQRTGWSGDGAPGNGTLREFAIGAVTQHFTRKLERRAGIDFRLPSDDELDAMEAFQLFTGRDADPDLTQLKLRSPLAASGQAVFLRADTEGGTLAAGKCNLCHANAGANLAGTTANFNFDTGVEAFPDPADRIDPANSRPDGGFGTSPSPTVPGAFGNGTFNTPPLVEAADTAPFFHNNAVATLEGAVNFYNSGAFANSPSGQFLSAQDSGGIAILMRPPDVTAVGAFLRVLNCLENIRATGELVAFIRANQGSAGNAELFKIAIAEANDALEVLLAPSGNLDPAASGFLRSAAQAVSMASRLPPGPPQVVQLEMARLWLKRSRVQLQLAP